ncbi:MAG TPA: MarR family transcriptional regulator [Candidatus Avidesulfovibrio excrementigallinarum]|nr:MarR family transcriptional regulator [Candidatus Avidesulfovibrio excrementigallinarum]
MSQEDYVFHRNQHWKELFPDLQLDGVWGRVQRLARCHNLLSSQAMRPFGLRNAEADVLAALLFSGEPYELTPKQITAQCYRTPGAITGILDALAARGLITRHPNEKNRRSYIVALTEQGVQLAKESFFAQIDTEKKLLNMLAAGEKKALAALLKKVLIDLEGKKLI